MALTDATRLADFSSGVGTDGTLSANNINATGIVTAATLKVGSAVTVSGGIVTATTGSFSGTVTANAFSGDGSELTGVSGFATALSTDQTSVLNRFFKTPEEIAIGAGTSISITSDDASGNVAFCREGKIHVAVGATFHVGSGTTLATNVLGVF